MFAPAPLPRPLDAAESFFWLLDSLSSMNFAVIAEGQGPLSHAAVAAALPPLQQRHPLLQAAIEADTNGRLQFVPANATPEFSDEDCLTEHWRTRLAQAIVRPFPLACAPLFRVHLYRLPEQRWALAINFHHSIGDARSGYTVLRELLLLASGQSLPPSPVVSPRPPLTQLYPPHWLGDAAQEAANVLRLLKRDEDKQAPEPLPGYRELRSLNAPDFVSLDFSAEELSALSAQAKAHQVTLHGVIGAAELLALRRQQPGDDARCLMLTSPADLRATLTPPMDSATPGFYVTLLRPAFQVSSQTDFWELANEVTGKTRHHFQRGDGHLLFHMMPPAHLFPPTPEGVAAFSEAMARGPQTALLSNAGRIAPIATGQDIRVETLSFSLCPAPKQPFFASVTTYEGRMRLNFMFDAERLPKPLLQAIVQDMETTLRALANAA